MKEIIGNLWNFYGKEKFVICLTTNGFVKQNGEAVMGRGCAQQAKRRIEGIAAQLGHVIELNGNVVQWLTKDVLSFPVKHNWFENADIVLIGKSATALAEIATSMQDKTFILPRPGCGNGNLPWESVKEVIEQILPDNVEVIHWGKYGTEED